MTGKLVRDGVPALMRARGWRFSEHRLDDQAYVTSLRAKLVEEADEAQAAESTAALVEELADLKEVMLALAAASGFDAEAIETARLAKRAERGGFDGRVFCVMDAEA